MLAGHGSSNTMTAEISTLPNKNVDGSQAPSDFINVMNTFNNDFRTKLVSITSCYVGGKKIVDSYSAINQFNNTMLENLSYPIINRGSRFEATLVRSSRGFDYGESFGADDRFIRYFNLLNEIPPDYQKATKIMSQKLKENYASIKFPHTSWFSPVQYEKEVQEFSQVAMSTAKSPISVSQDIRIILLGANYISQPIQLDGEFEWDLPKFLPVNYYNQNYCLESLKILNINKSFDQIFSLLIDSAVVESINVIFKQMQTKTGIYKNVHVFTHQDINSDGSMLSGYIYTNAQGETKIASWESGQKMPASVRERDYDTVKAQVRIDAIESKIKKGLPDALKPDALKNLSSVLEAKKSESNVTDVQSQSNWVKDPVTKKWSNTPAPKIQAKEDVSLTPEADPTSDLVKDPITENESNNLPAPKIPAKKNVSSMPEDAESIENQRLNAHKKKGLWDRIRNVSFGRNSKGVIDDNRVSLTEFMTEKADAQAVQNRQIALKSKEVVSDV